MGIFVLTFIAFVASILLVIVNLLFGKPSKTSEFEKRLPGYNCGSCGYGSCAGMAHAMMEDLNNYTKCKPLRGEKLKEMENYLSKLER